MRSALVFSALAALAAANPGAVSGSIAPTGPAPAGCSKSYNGEFGISPTNISSDSTTKRSLKPRDSDLTISLTNGVLKDSQGRTGYVAANEQFQFDKPPQAGAIYTAGFTICSNGSLALGDDAIWYSCLSGDFYNLYFKSQGGQCFPVTLQVVGGSSAATTAATSGATAAPATGTAAPPATGTAAPACTEYVDGQPQCTTAAPAPVCSEYVDGQPQCQTAAVCSEYVDGQPQCETAAAPTPSAACSEYVDGQPQCATAAPPAPVCSEYVDGQPQCTTAAPPATTPAAVCSEYVDGQPQCTTAAPPAPVCSEYVDGQPQCTTAAPPAPACSEYVDGQPQCSIGTMPVATASYTGAPIASGLAVANGVHKEMFGLAAGVVAFAALL